MTTRRRGAHSRLARAAAAAAFALAIALLLSDLSDRQPPQVEAPATRVATSPPGEDAQRAVPPDTAVPATAHASAPPRGLQAQERARPATLALRPSEAPPRTWWSDALGVDSDDPSVVLNTDDAIFDAIAAGLLQRSDVRVLEDWIAANALDEASSPYDLDDGDGLLSWWEFGFQVWQDGRLVAFALGPDPHSSFRYELDSLPASIEDLDGLRYLGLQHNQLQELPAELGRLSQLEQLIASHNALTSLPDGIDGLRSLTRLVLTHNQLSALPPSIGWLDSLHALHVADNPLVHLPDELSRLTNLRVLDLSRGAGHSSAPLALPDALAELPNLHEMYLAGHALPCPTSGAAGTPLVLRDGSVVTIYGLAAGTCVR